MRFVLEIQMSKTMKRSTDMTKFESELFKKMSSLFVIKEFDTKSNYLV